MSIPISVPCVYVYVDGESHYIRTEAKAKQTLNCRSLDEIERASTNHEHSIFNVRSDCNFVWDTTYLGQIYEARKYYFTSFTGQEADFHDAKETLRSCGFDPEIIREDKDKRKRRKSQSEDLKLIEKAKGCDISLAVRMIEDAANDNYESAWLFTSDADFLPVIKTVRRMGKYITVCGYKENLGDPEFAYVPDRFIDLGRYFTHPIKYQLKSKP